LAASIKRPQRCRAVAFSSGLRAATGVAPKT